MIQVHFQPRFFSYYQAKAARFGSAAPVPQGEHLCRTKVQLATVGRRYGSDIKSLAENLQNRALEILGFTHMTAVMQV